MGANQSSDNSGSAADGEGQSINDKTCYYELLGIDSKASEEE